MRDPDAGSPHAPAATIARDELWARVQAGRAAGRPFPLFEVLPRGYWRKQHLPGAISAPPEQAPGIIAEHVPDPHAELVVYCWDDT